MSTIFSKIISGEIPSDFIYEDEKCIAINDINPKADIHILIIPKKEISTIFEMEKKDKELIGHLHFIWAKIAKEKWLEWCKMLFNVWEKWGQEIFHIHLHLMGNL